MVSGSAIGTLAVFILSIFCVIRPFSIPIFGRKFPINLTTAPIIAILVLWAAQCLVAKNVSLQFDNPSYGLLDHRFATVLCELFLSLCNR